MLGVIDRFEAHQAVILIESEKREIIVTKNTLPLEAVEGTWLNITQTGQDAYTFQINMNQTNKQRSKAQSLREKLLNKNQKSAYKK